MKNKFYVLTAALCLALASSGCVALVIGAAAGAGGMAYVKGKVEKDFDVTVAQLHEVTLKTLEELRLGVLSDELNTHSAVTTFEFDDGKKGEAKITANTEHSARLLVRVGIVGDEVRSRMIANAIQRNL